MKSLIRGAFVLFVRLLGHVINGKDIDTRNGVLVYSFNSSENRAEDRAKPKAKAECDRFKLDPIAAE